MSLFQIYHPEVFQGSLKRKNYFEGWYYKHVSQNYNQVLALIPGISLTEDPHAFIQIIDGKSGQTEYVEYPITELCYESRSHDLSIGPNRFTRNFIELAINDKKFHLSGKLIFFDSVRWPIKPWAPGIMGWYRWVPKMECYHGVVSVNHGTHGSLESTWGTYDFDLGYGYIEKDWGTSFPECWIWMHANCFSSRQTALMTSIAKIPWRGRFFVGFLCFLYHQGKIYRFLTYNRSKLTRAVQQDKEIHLHFKSPKYALEIKARQNLAGKLKAPVNGHMERYIKESIDSEVSFELFDTHGVSILKDNSRQAGLEIVGDVISLL